MVRVCVENQEILDDEVKKYISLRGNFDSSSLIKISKSSWELLKKGKLRLAINHIGGAVTIEGFTCELKCGSADIKINVGGGAPCHFKMGEKSTGNYNVTMYRGSLVSIGEATTSNGCRIFCDNSFFRTGYDCMISDEVLFQTSDQHGIFDLTTGNIINKKVGGIELFEHVWVGRRSTLVGKFTIGSGSIIASGAVVAKKIESNCVVAGNPAKMIRDKVSWCRHENKMDKYVEDNLIHF